MDKQEYFAKLRDPRWQKMRLEVMQRDEFRCISCGSAEKTLNVHHCYYEWGNDPWEYPLTSLLTLCEECHEYETEALKVQKKALLGVLGKHGFTSVRLGNMAKALDHQLSKAKSQHQAACITMDVLRSDSVWDMFYSFWGASAAQSEQDPPAE